jgi:hypothetical protein
MTKHFAFLALAASSLQAQRDHDSPGDVDGPRAVYTLTRLKLPEGLYTGIWWYARFPNHYAGEGAVASRELGEFEAKTWINGIVQAIRAVKAHRLITGGIGHNLPQEAPRAFSDALVQVDRY